MHALRRPGRVAALLLALAAPGATSAHPPGGQAPRTAPSPLDAVRVIVHPATAITSITRDELSRVFLRKVARWPNGPVVQPVDLDERAPARHAFTRGVHQRSVDMIVGYWQRQIFSGRQLPPPSRRAERDVVAYVRETPGAIGYVSAGAELQGVRVVAVRDE